MTQRLKGAGMLRRGGFVLVVVILLVAATGFTASLAVAGGSADALIDDASDGVVDGSYSIAVVRTALSVVRSDPVYSQYSDIEGVLVDYLATLTQSDGGGSGVDKPSTPAPTTPTPTPTSVKTSPSPRPTHTKAGTGKTQADRSDEPTASARPKASSPVPSVGGWERVRVRLAAIPWFFAIVAGAVAAGVLLVRRRRAG